MPILRAGLVIADPTLYLIPQAEIRHRETYRNEQSVKPVRYWNKLPEDDASDVVPVLDPMLATGGSSSAVIAGLQAGSRHGCSDSLCDRGARGNLLPVSGGVQCHNLLCGV